MKNKIIASDKRLIRESKIDNDTGGSQNVHGLISFVFQNIKSTKISLIIQSKIATLTYC